MTVLGEKTLIVNYEMKYNPKRTLAAIKNLALHHILYFAVIRQSSFKGNFNKGKIQI